MPARMVILVGPTASGKTDVAHILARRLRLAILSADSMMIYRGMNIGTAKPSSAELEAFQYAGIDLVDPDQEFSAHAYWAAVAPEISPPKRRLVVGGTGLYLRALLGGLDDSAGANTAWREEAEALLEREGFDALKTWCRKRRPEIDRELPAGDLGNPRRWIRAVERERPVGSKRMTTLADDVRIFGLRRDREDLSRRIRLRVEAMFAAGLVEEVAHLRSTYATLSSTAARAIGYAEAMAVLDGTASRDEAMERTATRTRHYAKRQMTWFRHQLPVTWVDVREDDDAESIASHVAEGLSGTPGEPSDS